MKKILIANRGEIASRIIRSAHSLGFATIAIYDRLDQDAQYVREASERWALGSGQIGEPLKETYLNITAICEIAHKAGAWAIHPGYGFLSENAAFAKKVRDEGLVFIGPHHETIELMGDKGKAKAFVKRLGLPTIPGYLEEGQSIESLTQAAFEVGFPLMIKAAHGGGGRGIRLMPSSEGLQQALESAAREAEKSFGNGRLILERQIYPARHIEVQILGDGHGQVVSLGERDCSLQRRQQKIIEEGPAANLSEETRRQLLSYARKICQEARYLGAGTVEFLVDSHNEIYFLEMNTRIQVEHPVTEAITGVDLISEQIKIARGDPFDWQSANIEAKGHAIEVRLYSEDPSQGFRPQTGTIHKLSLPCGSGVRIDHSLFAGQLIRSDLDPMMAKLIVWGEDRSIATGRMVNALESLVLLGVNHNAAYLCEIMKSQWFTEASFDTRSIDNWTFKPSMQDQWPLWAALVVEYWGDSCGFTEDFWALRNSLAYRSPFNIELAGIQYKGHVQRDDSGQTTVVFSDQTSFQVKVLQRQEHMIRVLSSGNSVDIYAVTSDDQIQFSCGTSTATVINLRDRAAVPTSQNQNGQVHAPMEGAVTKILVDSGAQVAQGQTLVILEAMKMEHEIKAPFAGVVQNIGVNQGQQVKHHQFMVSVAPIEPM